MHAYKPSDLYNRYVQNSAGEAFEDGSLSETSYQKVLEAYPSALYTPDLFIRIGIGFVSLFAVLFFGLLVGLASLQSSESGYIGACFFIGLSCYGVLELLLKNKQYYNAGVDNILLLSVVCFMAAAMGILTKEAAPVYWVMIPVCLLLSIRFADAFMALLAYVALLIAVLYLCLYTGSAGKYLAPFVLMLVSAFVYRLMHAALKRERWLVYARCFDTVKLFSLVGAYAAGNYYMVKEMGDTFLNGGVPAAYLPAGWLFWLLTAVIPTGYLIHGIRSRQLLFVRLGLLLLIASVLTFRYYHSIMPAEVALVLAGAVLLVLGWWLLWYLKTAKQGFTAAVPARPGKDRLRTKSLILLQVIGKKGAAPQHTADFGGGTSGGGGASSDY